MNFLTKTAEVGVEELETLTNNLDSLSQNMNELYDKIPFEEIFSFLGKIFILFLIFSLIFGIFKYILYGLGLSKILKKENEENTWMAYFPIMRKYILVKAFIGEKASKWFLLSIILLFIPGVNMFVILAWNVLKLIAHYRIYERYTLDDEVILLLLNVLLPISEPFILLSLGSKEKQKEVKSSKIMV